MGKGNKYVFIKCTYLLGVATVVDFDNEKLLLLVQFPFPLASVFSGESVKVHHTVISQQKQ